MKVAIALICLGSIGACLYFSLNIFFYKNQFQIICYSEHSEKNGTFKSLLEISDINEFEVLVKERVSINKKVESDKIVKKFNVDSTSGKFIFKLNSIASKKSKPMLSLNDLDIELIDIQQKGEIELFEFDYIAQEPKWIAHYGKWYDLFDMFISLKEGGMITYSYSFAIVKK